MSDIQRNAEARYLSRDIARDIAQQLTQKPDSVSWLSRRCMGESNMLYAKSKAKQANQPVVLWIDIESTFQDVRVDVATMPLYPYLGEMPCATVLPYLGYSRFNQ